ncbi:hypothetical protein DFJ73DRAFT_817101 [Zopfochytrium polystomum]|nr:hypothetical protein DFJ73DRAFT_817101 [Zopfochytrium polystomum]
MRLARTPNQMPAAASKKWGTGMMKMSFKKVWRLGTWEEIGCRNAYRRNGMTKPKAMASILRKTWNRRISFRRRYTSAFAWHRMMTIASTVVISIDAGRSSGRWSLPRKYVRGLRFTCRTNRTSARTPVAAITKKTAVSVTTAASKARLFCAAKHGRSK